MRLPFITRSTHDAHVNRLSGDLTNIRYGLIKSEARELKYLDIIEGFLNGRYTNHEMIGIAFTNWGSDEQAQFLNSVGGAFDGWEKMRYESQLCWLSDELNPQSQAFILELAEFIKLKDNK